MAARKSVMKRAPNRPELDALLEDARHKGVTDEQLQEQRVSFAYGNAPAGAERITKEARDARAEIAFHSRIAIGTRVLGAAMK